MVSESNSSSSSSQDPNGSSASPNGNGSGSNRNKFFQSPFDFLKNPKKESPDEGIEEEYWKWKDPRDFDEKGNKKWKREKSEEKNNFGVFPHRCDDRFDDFIHALVKNWFELKPTFQIYWRCLNAKPG